jgi:hypothetical protein
MVLKMPHGDRVFATSPPNNGLVESNEQALRKTYPQYADILSAVPDTRRYTFHPAGASVACRDAGGRWVHGPYDPWESARREVAPLLNEDDGLYVVLRPGLGYHALAILEALEGRGPGSFVLVVEDRLDLWKAGLAFANWAPVLRATSASLLLGRPDFVIEAFIRRHPKLCLLPITLVSAPDAVDREEREHIVAGLTELSTATRGATAEQLDATDAIIRQRRKLGQPTRVLLAGDHGYLAGPLTDGFRACGCNVEALPDDPRTPRHLRAHDWPAKVAEVAPDLVCWLNRPELSRFGHLAFRALGIANVVWSVDSPRRARLTRAELETVDVHLYFDTKELHTYAGLGARHSEHLSLGSGIDALPGCGPSEAVWPPRLGPDVSFVGSHGEKRIAELKESMRRMRPEDLEFLDELASQDGDPAPIFESETAKRYAGLPVLYVDELRTSRRRTAVLSAMLPLDLRIFGTRDWAEVEGPLAECYVGSLRYGPDLASVYYHSRINLNVFHAQCEDSTNSRVYDVLAAGGFLLTEDRPILHREFDVRRHLVTFSTPAEAAEKAAYYLAHPAERESIAREGQLHVLAHHTLAHRCRRILGMAQPFMRPDREA